MSDIELRFLSDEAFIEDVTNELSADSSIKMGTPTVVTDPSDLSLDFITVSAVIGLFSDLFMSGPIIPALGRVIRRSESRRVRIESPFGVVTFEPRRDMSDAEIRDLLRRLVESL